MVLGWLSRAKRGQRTEREVRRLFPWIYAKKASAEEIQQGTGGAGRDFDIVGQLLMNWVLTSLPSPKVEFGRGLEELTLLRREDGEQFIVTLADGQISINGERRETRMTPENIFEMVKEWAETPRGSSHP